MILALITQFLLGADCSHRLSARWHEFKRAHLIDYDRSDPQTRQYLEELEREKREKEEDDK